MVTQRREDFRSEALEPAFDARVAAAGSAPARNYRMAVYDLRSGPRCLRLEPDEDGLALTVTWRGAPVGFAMRAMAPEQRAEPIDLRGLVDAEMHERAIAQAVRAELARDAPPEHARRLSLSVVICTRQRAAYLERCLAAIEALDRGALHELERFEILVIDNAPLDDSTRAVVARHPEVRYVLERRAGLNFARNRALHEAAGDLLAYVDDDVVVDPGWLRGLVAAWSEDPDVGLITGQVLPLELATPAQVLFEQRGGFRRGFRRTRCRGARPDDPLFPCTASFLGTGANMAVDRHAVLALRGFDTALDTGTPLPGGGDIDIYYRLVRAGYRAVYDPAYLARHLHRRDYAGLLRQYRDSWGMAFAAYVAKSWVADPPMRLRWKLLMTQWFATQFRHLLLSLRKGHLRPTRLIWAETWGAVVGLIGGYGRSRRRTAAIERRAR